MDLRTMLMGHSVTSHYALGDLTRGYNAAIIAILSLDVLRELDMALPLNLAASLT